MPVLEVLTSHNRSSKKCYICGQAGAAFHYGTISCLSCKAFFRRAVRMSRDYQCSTFGACHIDQERRIFCRKCRLDKCLQVGMKPEDVQPKREPKQSVNLKSADGFQQDSDSPKLQKQHKPLVEQRSLNDCSPDRNHSDLVGVKHPNLVAIFGYPAVPGDSVLPDIEPIIHAPLASNNYHMSSIDHHANSINRHVPSVELSPVASIHMTRYLVQDQVCASQDDTAFADIDVGAFNGDCLFINCDDAISVAGPSPFLSPPVLARGLDLAVMPPSAFTAFTGDLSETAPAGGYNVGWVLENLMAMDQIIDAHLSKAVSRASMELTAICEADLVSPSNHHKLTHFELQAHIVAMREFGLFRMLARKDQIALLRNGCYDSKMLGDLHRSKHTTGYMLLIDKLHKALPAPPGSPFVQSDLVFDVLMNRYRELNIDAAELCCLKAILFWDPDTCSHESKSFVRTRQTIFMGALEDYVRLKENYTPGRVGVLLWFFRIFKDITNIARKGLMFLISSGLVQGDPLNEDLLEDPSSDKIGAISELLQNSDDWVSRTT